MRNSTAISLAGVPAAISARDPAGDGRASATSSGSSRRSGSGPAGRCASSSSAVRRPVGLPASDPVGQRDDLRGGAVVADQPTTVAPRVPAREVEQVVGRGAGEGVDRLARVADDAELVAAAEPQVEQRLLQRADVLELVDDEVLVLPAHLVGDLPVLGEQRRR